MDNKKFQAEMAAIQSDIDDAHGSHQFLAGAALSLGELGQNPELTTAQIKQVLKPLGNLARGVEDGSDEANVQINAAQALGKIGLRDGLDRDIVEAVASELHNLRCCSSSGTAQQSSRALMQQVQQKYPDAIDWKRFKEPERLSPDDIRTTKDGRQFRVIVEGKDRRKSTS